MYTAGYKQNTKTSLAKPPFTPVNAPGSNSGYQTANAGQNAAPGQQAPSQRQAQMQYMSQPQVAAVLTHQPPPAPPPSSSQNQSVQPGQNTGANRGIPPPPQPSQGQNYPTGPSSNQPSGQQFIPQQGYNASPANADNMHTYTGPSRPIAYPNAAYFSHQAYFIANQNHQQMHYDNQSNYMGTTPQGAMFPPAPFIYPANPQWIPHPTAIPGQHMHRAQNAPSAAPSVPGSAQQATVETPVVYPNAPIIPNLAYQQQQPQQYPTFTPNPNQQQQQSYQKREKKPLLIVDPNSKKPINLQNQSQSASSTHTTNTTTTTTTTTSTNSTTANTSSGYKAESDRKSDKKDSAVAVSINEDKKLDTTVNEDFQTQIIRKMKDQQHTAEEIDSNVAKPSASSKQVTVSVPQPQPQSHSQTVSTGSKPNEAARTETKAETREETKAERKEEIKEESKANELEIKEEVKKVNVNETKDETKEEAKEEAKGEAKEEAKEEEKGKGKKKRYDREFLLSFKDSDQCKQIPEHLKDLDIFKELKAKTGGQQYYGKSSYGAGQDQSYNKGSMSKMRSKNFSSMNKYHRGSMEGRVSQVEKEVTLNRVENPYTIKKPSNEHEELLREVRIILNKLTPQNLQKLTGDLLSLPINTEDRLKDSIHIIFEKSLDEQVFSQTYADLCRQMTRITVPLESDPSKFVTFRTMLLTKCQREFDSDYIQNVNYESLIAEADEHTDETKRNELKELANEKLAKAKRRSLGNIRFIGELFKLKMLTEGIMNDCIDRLLKQDTDEENLECLCKLLTTIGKELDRPNNAQRIKSYFDRLDKIARRKEVISARIRFMIMDVIDLRKNQWVPRRKDAGPRKIDEIRREADEEKARLEAEQARQQAQGGRQKGGKYPPTQQAASKSTSMDSSSLKAQNGSMASKIKDVKQITNKNSGELTLGPGGSSGYSWNKYPKSAAAQEASIPQSASFSVQKRVAEPVSRASLDSKSAKDRVQAVKRMDSGDYSRASDSSQPSSRDSSLTRIAKKNYTQDEIERKTVSLVNELVQNKIIAESIKDLEEFCPLNADQYSEFVEKLIMVTLEKNQNTRTLLGQFFYAALKDKKLDIIRFEQGLKRVIEVSEDMSIDVPKISTYLGQIIAPLFNENFSLNFLKAALEPVRELKLSAEIVAEALRLASERLGHSTVNTVFKASNLKLEQFLDGVDNKQEFIGQNKLEWLNGQNCDKVQSTLPVDSYETVLNKILASNEENTGVFDQIEALFQEHSSKPFIRALVIAVCNSCYSGKIDPELFKKRSHILKRYINQTEDLELEALYAVQALDHRLQHQPGYIRVIFDLLYDEDLIREEVYFKWKNKDKEEGHAISVLSLKQFFEWLSDPDNENADGANENR